MSENKASTGLVIKLVLTGLVTGLIVPLTAAVWLFFKHQQLDASLFFNQELMPVFVATPFITAFVGFISATGVQKQFKRIFNLLSRQKQIVQSVTVFAEKIGTGDLNAEFQPSGDEDMLGKAILNMRENLVKANIEEENRNWIVTGVAEVGGIVRNNTELKGLGDAMVSYLTKKLNAVQAGFYVINDNDPADVYLDMLSSFAYNRMKRLKAKFYFGQGLVGQAAIEQDTIYRTEIPNDYVTITSGLLGDQKPKAILIVPLITNEKVYGVIELASFERFNPTHIKYVQQLSDILARTIFNININAKTKALLEESQQMSIALGEQTAQLEQNAEEMRATQEELQRNNVQLEYTVQEVIRGQQRTQVLLENASEVINIYDENGNITYASPSIKNILGYEPEELVGKSGNNIVHQDGVEIMNKMFADLIAKPEESITVQYPGLRPNGEIVWLESTGRNLVNDPAIQGILFNTIDITERLMAEKEQRERAKMQALSENSPDIILRFDLLRKISYCNPTIEKFTGLNEVYFRGQHISELKINPDIIEKWKFFIDEIELNKQKIATEMVFVTHEGAKLYMEVNAIPEFDDASHLESVLMVLHDITEAKLAEMEITEKNHKIEESINYARRIQASILPKPVVLSSVFPESMMLFMPRDIVSGDFPFIVQHDEWLYAAAVDCTGHGVPGALLSVIGTLILSELTRYDSPTASVLCDKLHELVVKTLRQGQEGSENDRDGMDIAMCKINTKTGALQFAGAHRPLYILRNNYVEGEELEQIKGDKYPIGGVQYKGRENFTNEETTLTTGDRIFFFSDGYPDQFGGGYSPPKKVGPKRIRDIITNNRNIPMPSMHDIFMEEFFAWKGEEKQMDDVLVIGIQF